MIGLLLIGITGLFAQLVDGSLGMGYGVTSASLLLAIGLSPAIASATVHFAQIGTTLASGLSHWRFGNVDWPTVRVIAGPGAAGAFLGAITISLVSAKAAKPFVAAFLFCLGLVILIRFLRARPPRPREGRPSKRFLAPLGGFAGFMDAAGGGGWGPIGTSSLISSGRMEPRKVIGSIDTSEFVVTVAASIGFVVGLGLAGIDFAVVGALLAGGVVAAPLAAWVVRHLPAAILGAAVGGLILLTNAGTLGSTLGAGTGLLIGIHVALAAVWAGAIALAWSRVRRARPAAEGRREPAHAAPRPALAET